MHCEMIGFHCHYTHPWLVVTVFCNCCSPWNEKVGSTMIRGFSPQVDYIFYIETQPPQRTMFCVYHLEKPFHYGKSGATFKWSNFIPVSQHIVQMERVGRGKKAAQIWGWHENELIHSFEMSPHLTCLTHPLNIPLRPACSRPDPEAGHERV